MENCRSHWFLEEYDEVENAKAANEGEHYVERNLRNIVKEKGHHRTSDHDGALLKAPKNTEEGAFVLVIGAVHEYLP